MALTNATVRRQKPSYEYSERKFLIFLTTAYKTSGKTKNKMGVGVGGRRRRAEDEWKLLLRVARAQKGL